MTSDSDVSMKFRDEMDALPKGWRLRARLWHTRVKETRTRLGGAQGEAKSSIRLNFYKYKPYILELQAT